MCSEVSRVFADGTTRAGCYRLSSQPWNAAQERRIIGENHEVARGGWEKANALVLSIRRGRREPTNERAGPSLASPKRPYLFSGLGNAGGWQNASSELRHLPRCATFLLPEWQHAR